MGRPKKTEAQLLKEAESLRAHIETRDPKRQGRITGDRLSDQRQAEVPDAEDATSGLPVLVAIDAFPIPMVISRLSDGKILYANPIMESVFDIPTGEAIGRITTDFYDDPTDRATLLEELHRYGSVQNREVRVRKPDGETLWVTVSMRSMTHNGEPAIFCVYCDIAKQRRTEAKLKQSEAKLHTLYASSNEAITLLDENAIFRDCNDAALRMFGCKNKAEFCGKRPSEFSPAKQPCGTDSAVLARQLLTTAMEQGIASFEWTHRRLDSNELVLFEVVLFAAEEDGRKVLHAIGRDITRHKKAEDELRKSERRYRAIVEDQTELICRWQPDKTHTFVNEAYCRCFGKRPEELVGHSLMDLIPSEDHAEVLKHFATLSQENPVATHEHLVLAHGDKIRLHQWTDRAFFNSDGNIVEYQSVGRDITDRKRAEDKLRWSEERFRTIVEASKDAVIAINSNGEVVIFNAAAEKMFGCAKETMTGQPLDCLIPEEYRSRHGANVRAFFKSGKPDGAVNQTLELPALRTDGTQFPIELSLSSARYRDQHLVVAIIRDITERREAELELRKFKSVSDRTPHGHAIVDLEGHVLYINEAFAAMHGYRPEELLGQHLSVFHTEEQLKQVEALNKPLAQGGSFSNEEVWHKRRDGSVFPTLMDGIVITDESGSPVFMSGMATDITHHKEADEALRTAEEQLRSTLSSMSDLVFVLDHDGRFIDYHQPSDHEDLYVSPDKFLGVHYSEVLPPHLSKITDSVFSQCMSTGVTQRYDYYLEIDGKTEWFSATMSIRRDTDGKPAGVTTVARNITERKQAEEALLESRDRYRALFEESPVLLREYDLSKALEHLRSLKASGLNDLRAYFDHHPEEVQRCASMARIVALNRASVEFYGARNKEELIARIDETLNTPDHVDHLKEQLIALSEGRIPDSFDKTVKTLSGEIRHLSVHLSVPGWARGSLTRIIYAGTDITERKRIESEKARLQTQLQHTHKMEAVGSLASGIAHDFNNLLTVIFGYTDIAKASLPDHHAAIKSVEMVEQAARQARGVTNALLTFSHKGTAEKTPIDLVESVSDSTQLLRRFLPASIDVSEDFPERSKIWVRADPTQLQQVWMNLAINARDAMPLGGRLHVALRVAPPKDQTASADTPSEKSQSVLVTISDTGKGMSKGTKDRIFEPFFTTKPRGQGTGLGLSVIHAIIQNHDGKIEIESQEGCGTQVCISLPMCVPPSPRSDADRRKRQKPGFGERIIVVEDNEHVRSIITSSLRRQGYEVTGAADTTEALEALNRHGETVSLVLLDLDIPGAGPLRIAEEVHHRKPNVPILIVTGGVGHSATEGGTLENTVLLRKPFPMSKLHECVERILEECSEKEAAEE